MVSPPQQTEKKNGIPLSQVDLNGTALIAFDVCPDNSDDIW